MLDALLALLVAAVPQIPFALDGRVDDWRAGAGPVDARADERFLVVRFELPEERALQGGDATTRVLLDLDGDAATGLRIAAGGGADAIGADAELALSPPDDGRPRAGIELRPYAADGSIASRRKGGLRARDVLFLPSHAARAFELRIARDVDLPAPLDAAYEDGGRIAGCIVALDAGGRTIAELPFAVEHAPAARALDPAPGPGAVPDAAPAAIRAVSWNVEHSAPEKDAAPFARVLRALAPDVVLVQEWQATSDELAAWFSAHVPAPSPWRAASFPDLGVAVVARHPLVPLDDDRVMPDAPVNGRARPVRVVGARIDHPAGALVAASVHLKCCGSLGSHEDAVRLAEARAVNRWLRGALAADATQDAAASPPMVLLAGDMNLVGARPPLDLLRDGLDADGSALDVADALVLGDDAAYTWRNDDGRFARSRLDYAAFSDATCTARAFVFDAACSDHLPLVVDLAPRDSAPDALPAITDVGPDDYAAVVRRAGDGEKAVLVNFWATWCRPCVAELPDLLAVAAEHRDRGLRLVLVSCDFEEQRGDAARLLARLGVDFETFLKVGKDEPFIAAVSDEWSGALPFTVLYDAAGTKLAVHSGEADRSDFERLARQGLGLETE